VKYHNLLVLVCVAIFAGFGARPVHAQTQAIYFGNGVWVVDQDDAYASMEELREAIRPSLTSISFESTRFDIAFNQSLGHWSDIAETARQIVGNEYPTLLISTLLRISGVPAFLVPSALSERLNDVLRNEAARQMLQGSTSATDVSHHVSHYRNDFSAGRKVVIVGHSQGNLFANLAIDQLTESERMRLAAVPVASPDREAKRSLVGHVTFLNDSVINLVQILRELAGLDLALLGNDFADAPGTVWAHEFSENYLRDSSARQFIVSGVVASLELLASAPPPPSGAMTRQPSESKDIWTTSVYSYEAGVSRGPGGGLNDDSLRVGGWGDEYRSLLSFSLTGLPAQASSARIELYSQPLANVVAPAIYVDRITQFWDWSTQGTGADRLRLWWADQPPATPLVTAPLPAPQQGAWFSIDVTTLYNQWQSGALPNYGIRLRPASTNNVWAYFYSADYTGDTTLRPRLVVTPGTPPSPAVVTFVASGVVSEVRNSSGLLPFYFGTVPAVGEAFSIRYSFDTATVDSTANTTVGTFPSAVRDYSVTVGSRPPVVFSATELTTNQIETRTTSQSLYQVLVGGPVPRTFSSAITLNDPGPTAGGSSDGLPLTPPVPGQYASAAMNFATTVGGGVDAVIGTVTSIVAVQ
jgi:hypothetical protein